MENNSEKLVEIFPNQIIFDLINLEEPHKHLNSHYIFKAHLNISNLTNDYIIFVFQIIKKSNFLYSVEPPVSFLGPKENKDINIRRFCEDKLLMFPEKEKFLIKLFASKEKPKEEKKEDLRKKISDQTPSQILTIKINQSIENISEFKGTNLIDISKINFDSVTSNYKFDIENLKNNYIYFEVYENFKEMKYISERRYINPFEKINFIFQKDKNTDYKEKERIIIRFYILEKAIKNNEEALQIYDSQLYDKNPIQTIFIKLNTNVMISEEIDKENNNDNKLEENKLFKNEINIKENEIIKDSHFTLYKINEELYKGNLSICNSTNNNLLIKIYFNNTTNYKVYKSILFVSPNNKINFYIKRNNSPISEKKDKILLILYTINKEIKNDEEAKEAFKLKLYEESSKKEIVLILDLKERVNISKSQIKTESKKNIKDFSDDKSKNDAKISSLFCFNKNENEKDKQNYISNIENKLEKEIIEMDNKITVNDEIKDKINLENQIYNNDSKEILISKLIEREKENKELKIKLSRYPFELNEGEKLICINFMTNDQKLKNYSIICKNTDKFITIEYKLYEDNPEFFETENYFISNGIKIDKNKSLEENNIYHNDVVILNQYTSEN